MEKGMSYCARQVRPNLSWAGREDPAAPTAQLVIMDIHLVYKPYWHKNFGQVATANRVSILMLDSGTSHLDATDSGTYFDVNDLIWTLFTTSNIELRS